MPLALAAQTGSTLGIAGDRRAVLTDNGSEFHAAFDEACRRGPAIVHYWTYPRSPRMTARTARFNRLFFRPRRSLDCRRPIDQYLSCLHLPQRQSRMWCTHTLA
jgi:hypothetical protein